MHPPSSSEPLVESQLKVPPSDGFDNATGIIKGWSIARIFLLPKSIVIPYFIIRNCE